MCSIAKYNYIRYDFLVKRKLGVNLSDNQENRQNLPHLLLSHLRSG